MICWFEAGVTDSFGPQLDGLATASGSCAGSACPHYDGEEQRRPRYRELVDSGFPEGIAADDGVGLHYVGTELREVVTCRPGATAYRVTRDGEETLQQRDCSTERLAGRPRRCSPERRRAAPSRAAVSNTGTSIRCSS